MSFWNAIKNKADDIAQDVKQEAKFRNAANKNIKKKARAAFYKQKEKEAIKAARKRAKPVKLKKGSQTPVQDYIGFK